MWKKLRDSFPKDRDFPERTACVTALQKVLDGSIYDDLRYGFHEEMNDAGEYIKLQERRPCIRYNLCSLAVEESVAMLFSDEHWPDIEHEDEETKETLRQIVLDTHLNETMIDAAHRGSVGSIALWLRVLEGHTYVDALDTNYLTPEWNPKRPDRLLRVIELYKVKGKDLRDQGYTIKDDLLEKPHWWQRIWDDQEECWYIPQPVDKEKEAKSGLSLKEDRKRTVIHGLGFVPIVWIKNLPGGDSVDGKPSLCDEAIETQISLEYLLSQGNRGLRYSSDPLLMIKEPAGETSQFVRSAGNAIKVSEKGDVKLVEISGEGAGAVLEFVKAATDLIKDQLHASRVNPEKLATAQSGRAMEILNQPLVSLSDKLRITYGKRGLVCLLDMIVRVGSTSQLMDPDEQPYPKLKVGRVSLKWPAWYPPTATDLSSTANTLKTHTDAGHMSRETAVSQVAKLYDTPDEAAELAKIKQDQKELLDNQVQIKETINA